MTNRNILKWLLIVSGLFLILAFAAVLLPVETMASVHQWLGLEDFPNRPITIYLARSTSLMYGVHGFLMFYTGLTLERHWRLAAFFGWLHMLIGVTVFFIDLTTPMPLYWIAMEGPPVALLGFVLLYLTRKTFANSSHQTETRD